MCLRPVHLNCLAAIWLISLEIWLSILACALHVFDNDINRTTASQITTLMGFAVGSLFDIIWFAIYTISFLRVQMNSNNEKMPEKLKRLFLFLKLNLFVCKRNFFICSFYRYVPKCLRYSFNYLWNVQMEYGNKNCNIFLYANFAFVWKFWNKQTEINLFTFNIN